MAPIRWIDGMALGNGFLVVHSQRCANITWIQLNQSGLGAIRVKPEEEDIGSHDMENFPILSPQSSRCCSLSPPGTYIVPTTSLSCRKQAKRQWQRADDDATLNDTDYIILLMLAGVRGDVSDDREHAALLKTSAPIDGMGKKKEASETSFKCSYIIIGASHHTVHSIAVSAMTTWMTPSNFFFSFLLSIANFISVTWTLTEVGQGWGEMWKRISTRLST